MPRVGLLRPRECALETGVFEEIAIVYGGQSIFSKTKLLTVHSLAAKPVETNAESAQFRERQLAATPGNSTNQANPVRDNSSNNRVQHPGSLYPGEANYYHTKIYTKPSASIGPATVGA
jgi:hypothetical protein